MKRSFLLLPLAITLPVVAAFAAPEPAPAPATPPVKVGPKKNPAAPRSLPPGVPGMAQPQMGGPQMPAHDHEHEAEAADDGKPKDPVGDSLDFLWKQSDVAFHAGDYPTAIKIHRAIVTLDPTDTESFGVGAWLLWSLGQKPKAREFIAQGLALNPKNPEMWVVAGGQYDLEKSFSDAKNAYMKAVALKGKTADEMLRRRLAHASELSGDLEMSEQTWIGLVRDFPASPVNKNNLARVKTLRAKPAAKAPANA